MKNKLMRFEEGDFERMNDAVVKLLSENDENVTNFKILIEDSIVYYLKSKMKFSCIANDDVSDYIQRCKQNRYPDVCDTVGAEAGLEGFAQQRNISAAVDDVSAAVRSKIGDITSPVSSPLPSVPSVPSMPSVRGVSRNLAQLGPIKALREAARERIGVEPGKTTVTETGQQPEQPEQPEEQKSEQ